MTTKTARAYRRIKHLIESGHINGGELLTEDRAIELTNMTRGPIRESLVRLESEGLLESRGHGRSRVVAYIEDQDPQHLLCQYELREHVEGAAARLAAKNMTGWQIDRLREMAKKITEFNQKQQDWSAEDIEANYAATKQFHLQWSLPFHEFLLANCGNSLLLDAWRRYRLAPLPTHSAKLHSLIMAEVYREGVERPTFEQIVDAIAAHDQDLAEALTKKGVRIITEAIRRVVMRETFDSGPGPAADGKDH